MKDKENIPVLNLFPNEYKVYTKKDHTLYIYLILGVMTFLMFMLGYLLLSQTTGSEVKTRAGSFLVILGVILLIITILWGIRRRIFTFVIAYILIVAVYIAEGQILYYLGIVSAPFSWGLVTLIILGAFSYWLGTKIEWDDSLKILLLMIVAYLLNASGWLAGANDIFSSLFNLKELLHHSSGVLMWRNW